jgi:hypothetical protein
MEVVILALVVVSVGLSAAALAGVMAVFSKIE